jgi:hypothetical protein
MTQQKAGKRMGVGQDTAAGDIRQKQRLLWNAGARLDIESLQAPATCQVLVT